MLEVGAVSSLRAARENWGRGSAVGGLLIPQRVQPRHFIGFQTISKCLLCACAHKVTKYPSLLGINDEYRFSISVPISGVSSDDDILHSAMLLMRPMIPVHGSKISLPVARSRPGHEITGRR